MNIVVALLFVALGIMIKYGKMYYLIAGYNTLPPEEQKKYDIDGIATVFRNGMFFMALMLLIGYGVSHYLENPKIQVYGLFIAIAIGLPYILVMSNSKKFKKGTK